LLCMVTSRFVFYGSGAIFLPPFRSRKRPRTATADVAIS
jgi:hypothetical protein